MAVDTTRLRSAVARFNRQIFDQASQGMLAEAEGAAPVDTGQTVREAKLTDRAQSDRAQTARLRFPTPQAAYTNDGTRPHPIRPRNKKALAFTIGGRRIIVAKVDHPGNEATHWFDRTVTNPRWAGLLQRAARTTTVT